MGRGTAGVVAATALLVTGCDTDEPLGLPGLPGGDAEEPDLDRVRTGLRDEQAVLDQLDRVRRRHPTLRRPLAPTVEVHRAHVQLLGRAVGGDGEADDGAPPAASRPRVPRNPTEALAQLVRLERSLAESHVETAMGSRSGVLARMVAAMSAAAAQQSVALTALASQQGPEQGGGG